MAASAVAATFISAGTPASSSEPGLPGGHPITSDLGTIYSDIAEYRVPTNSQTPEVRLANLHVHVAGDTRSIGIEARTTKPMPRTDHASFDERFNALYGKRFASFDERFGATTEDDRERTPRSVQHTGWLSAAEVPLEAPQRADIQQAMPAPATHAASAIKGSVGAAPNKAMRLAYAPSDAPLGDRSNRTAIYDISARAVYLPNGEKLEAHSGFGDHMDDPRFVAVRMKGATPPNVYTLSLRERLFHGVRAIRLTPVEPDKMFGRSGMLAHSYLLGPNGQSNGCVSIDNYPRFLNAFLNGEIDRLVVVDRLENPPPVETDLGWLSERAKAFFGSS